MTTVRSGRRGGFSRRGWRNPRVWALLTFSALAVTACSTEEPTPIEFGVSDGEGSGGRADESPGNDADHGDLGAVPDGESDINAGPRLQVYGFAEQQCLDDPEQVEGVVQIANPDTGEVVNEVRVPCDEVRERAAAGGAAGLEIIPEELRPDASGG